MSVWDVLVIALLGAVAWRLGSAAGAATWRVLAKRYGGKGTEGEA
jgi:hypothetical protein